MVAVDRNNIYIYDPDTNTAVAWETPIQYEKAAIGVSPDGNEIAIGYNDGSILWADLREVRANATPHPFESEPGELCTPKAPAFDRLVSR
jgi:DNA-binding beta-propeller fold protein YncE